MGDEGWRVSPSTRETLELVLLAVAGVVVVLTILFGDAQCGTPGWENYTDSRRETLREPAWSFWIALVVGQGALWGVLAPLLCRTHAALPGSVHWPDLVLTAGTLAGFTLIVDYVRYATRVQSPLPGHFGKTTAVTWLGTFVALVAVAGMVRVARGAWQLGVEKPKPVAKALGSYLELRDGLRTFLFAAGAVIAGAVLAGGALQIAADGYEGQTRRTDSVLLYGLFLSTLLAAAYAPPFAALQKAGERVLDALEAAPKEGEPDWPLGSERRRELRAYLELDAGLFQSLRVGIAVLAPLLSGLVTLLLSTD